MWRRFRHHLEYAAFRCVVCIVQALPWRTSVRACELLGFVFARILPRRLVRYHVARENLERAFGPLPDAEIDRLVQGMWTHLFRMVVEILQLPRKVRLYNSADVIGFRHRAEITQLLCSGRPVILLTGHFGNWEIANRVLGLYGFRTRVVARDLDNPHLHRWFARYRQAEGHDLVPKQGSADLVVEQLERRGVVGMLCDQDAGPKGVFVDFFGTPASTFKSIALLALQHRAVIAVTGTRRLPDDFARNRWSRFEIGVEEILDAANYADDPNALRLITERYTAALERAVRRAPEQYFWVHRRWKSEPRRRSRAKRAA